MFPVRGVSPTPESEAHADERVPAMTDGVSLTPSYVGSSIQGSGGS
jgi:hypothetical protein